MSGWDARELWIPFTKSTTLLQLLADLCFVPMLKGDLSDPYLLIGGRMVLVAKLGKSGFRPNVIGDSIR